jgi:hypothetical protein
LLAHDEPALVNVTGRGIENVAAQAVVIVIVEAGQCILARVNIIRLVAPAGLVVQILALRDRGNGQVVHGARSEVCIVVAGTGQIHLVQALRLELTVDSRHSLGDWEVGRWVNRAYCGSRRRAFAEFRALVVAAWLHVAGVEVIGVAT